MYLAGVQLTVWLKGKAPHIHEVTPKLFRNQTISSTTFFQDIVTSKPHAFLGPKYLGLGFPRSGPRPVKDTGISSSRSVGGGPRKHWWRRRRRAGGSRRHALSGSQKANPTRISEGQPPRHCPLQTARWLGNLPSHSHLPLAVSRLLLEGMTSPAGLSTPGLSGRCHTWRRRAAAGALWGATLQQPVRVGPATSIRSLEEDHQASGDDPH